MNNNANLQLMVRAAKLYYENMLTQQEVAQRLNITRQKVSRLLIDAKEKGIVRTVVYDLSPPNPDLGMKLKDKFQLHEVILTTNENLDEKQLRAGLGLAAAEYLKRTLQVDQNVGIGWGRTLYETVNMIRGIDQKRIDVIPLIGGVGNLSHYFQVNELARRLAKEFDWTYHFLYAPAFIEDRSVLDNLFKTQEVAHVAELWNKLDVAVVGVGHVEFQKISSMFFADWISPQTFALLEAEEAVGDICARFYDIHGAQVFPEPGVIGISLDQLKTIPEVIAIAGGREKVKALLGALRGGYIKTLITDIETARAVLAAEEERR